MPSPRIPPYERCVLDNGLTLVILPRHDVPLVAFNAVLRTGAVGDPPGKSGVAALTAGLLDKGAGPRTAFEFANAVEGAGGSFHAGVSAETLAAGGQFLARDQQLMLELLSDALIEPHFAGTELDKLRTRYIELLKAAKDSDPAELLSTYGRAFLFGRHPYGAPVSGSERSLTHLEPTDVLSFAARDLGADRLALVFAGSVDIGLLKQSVERTFGHWRRAQTPPPRIAPAARASERRVLLVDAPGASQTHFWIGNVGVDKRYPQRAALDLVNTLFGGRFTSMLNSELRIKSGLSYGAVSSFARGSAPGEFAIRSFVPTDATERAIDLALASLARLKDGGVSQQMLDSARAYVLGQYPLTLETAADWAAALGELAAYDLPPDYIASYAERLSAVTLADAAQVIEEAFPDPARVVIVLIGDAARIRGAVERYGALSELALSAPTFGCDV
jgi:zinc protease